MDRIAVVKQLVGLAKEVLAGHSYVVAELTLELTGWAPVDVNTRKELSQIYFQYADDTGDEHDDGKFNVRNIERLTPSMTYYQEQEMKKKKQAPVTVIRGTIPAGAESEAVKVLTKTLEKLGYKVKQL